MSLEMSRKEFARLLSTDAAFLRIQKNDKTPIGSFSPGGKNRFSAVPSRGNFGVIPQGRLFILDIDSHDEKASVEEQILAFSHILGIELETTLHVNTPSGGKHFYLKLPKGADNERIPRASLRGAHKILHELAEYPFEVDADLRSGAALAYIVGPGSVVAGKVYSFAGGSTIKTISRKGYANLVKIREESIRKDPVIAKRPAIIDIWKNEPVVFTNEKIHAMPPRVMISKLQKNLNRKHFKTFHEKRAWVKAAMSCCYDNDSIAKTCIELHIDKDTASRRNISKRALYHDVNRFVITESFHGVYCPERQDSPLVKDRYSQKDFDDFFLRKKQAISVKKASPAPFPGAGNPRVLDIEKIDNELLKLAKRKKPSQQYKDALKIVEVFLQPLANIGLGRMMLSRDGLEKYGNLSSSRAAQALKVLAAANIIEIAERQKTGFAPFYVVPEKYTHIKLTEFLRKTWGVNVLKSSTSEHKPSLLWVASTGEFVTALTPTVLYSNKLSLHIGEKQASILSINDTKSIFEVTASVLRYETEWRAAHNDFILESVIVEEESEVGVLSNNLVEYEQLTGEEGLTPLNSSNFRPGLRLRHRLWQAVVPPGLVSLDALGLGGESYKAPANMLSPPLSSS